MAKENKDKMKLIQWLKSLLGSDKQTAAGTEGFAVIDSEYHIHTQERIPTKEINDLLCEDGPKQLRL